MIVVIILTVLALVIPLLILRSFNFLAKALILSIILSHLALMFFLHYRLVRRTGYPIVIDIHLDTQTYYDNTSSFEGRPPFRITRADAIDSAGGSKHFGYNYVLGMLWTITSYPALAIRLLKTMLFFTGLSCLTRVWRRDYGSGLAVGGFAFLGVLCTPAFYYNYRNLKDGLILALFLFIMALLDTILPPWKNRLHQMSTRRITLAWFTVIILLYALSTLRLYVVTLIVMVVIMHAVVASHLGFKERVLLLVVLSLVVVLAFASPFVMDTMEMYKGSFRPTTFAPIAIIQGFLSPLPWGRIVQEEPCNVLFYSIYWLLLPYALYTLFRHLRHNINWRLFLYVMVTYVVGTIIGDAPRKRLIVYPILVGWVLAHLAYKRWVRAGKPEFAGRTEVDSSYNLEYLEDNIYPDPGKELLQREG